MNTPLQKLIRCLIVLGVCMAVSAYITLIYYSADLVQTYKNVDHNERCMVVGDDDTDHLSALDIEAGITVTFIMGFLSNMFIILTTVHVYYHNIFNLFTFGPFGAMYLSIIELVFCIVFLVIPTISTVCFRENFPYDTMIITIVVILHSFLPALYILVLGVVGLFELCKLIYITPKYDIIKCLCCPCISTYKRLIECCKTPICECVNNTVKCICCPCISTYKYIEGDITDIRTQEDSCA